MKAELYPLPCVALNGTHWSCDLKFRHVWDGRLDRQGADHPFPVLNCAAVLATECSEQRQDELVLENPLPGAFDKLKPIALPRCLKTLDTDRPNLVDIAVLSRRRDENVQYCVLVEGDRKVP